MAPECFEERSFALPQRGCMSPDSLREETYANFYTDRACDTFVELELYCDPLRNDMYLLHNLVSNPTSMTPIHASSSRISVYESAPTVNSFETTPRINSYRSAVYATAPVALYENEPDCKAINSSRASAYAFASEDGPDEFEAVRNLTREAVYATLPQLYPVLASNPLPLRGAVYSSMPTTPSALTPPATPSPKLSKKQTYAMLNAQRATTLSSSNLPSVSAAESSLARHAVYALSQSTDEIADLPPAQLRSPTLGNRARSATYSVNINNTISNTISGRTMTAMTQQQQQLTRTGPTTTTTHPSARLRGVSTSMGTSRVNIIGPAATAPLSHKPGNTIGSMSMESIPAITAYTSKTRTPSMVRTGSSKNLFALGATSPLLSSMIDEASSAGMDQVVNVPTVATPPRVKLTRVGHLGTIHQLQKFAC